MHEDTVRLLDECDAGIQMAVSSIDEVLPSVESRELRRTLAMSREAHQDLHRQTHQLLRDLNAPGKSPNPVAKSMSWMKTNMKLTMQPGDASIADLMVSGCNTGMKSLHKYQNQFPSASAASRQVADSLIGLEADLANSLYPYL